MARMRFGAADLTWQRTGDRDRVAEWVHGLPEASGTFTGTFASEVAATELFGRGPDLVPIEIDTYDRPNDAAALLPGQYLVVGINGEQWRFEVDHAEPLDGNRVRVWCHRPTHHSVE